MASTHTDRHQRGHSSRQVAFDGLEDYVRRLDPPLQMEQVGDHLT